MIRYFFILLFCLFLSVNTKAQIKLADKHAIKNVALRRGYAFSKFDANKSYLVWMEDFTGQLYIYNLATQTLRKKQLKKGRGPHEYLTITSLTLTPQNDIIMNDPRNIKWIIYNLKKDNYKKDIKLRRFKPSKISSYNSDIFFLNSGGFSVESSLYGLANLNHKQFKQVNMEEYSLKKEFAYVYKRSGWVASNKVYGVHLSLYYPIIYVIDITQLNIQKKIEFDRSQTKKGKTIDTGNGHHMYAAPTDYDISDKDIDFVPDEDAQVFILAKGKGEQRIYKADELRVFDLKKEKFTHTIDLGTKAEYIVVRNDALFAYSKDENRIYQYKIVHEK